MAFAIVNFKKIKMKKPTAILFGFLFIFSGAYSQIKKGNMQLGGDIGLSKYSQEQNSISQNSSSTNTSWSILPAFGYFVTETSSLGLGLGFDRFDQFYKSTNSNSILIGQPATLYNNENTNARGQFIIKPYYRIHKIVSQNFVLFAELNAFYGFGSREETNNWTNTEVDSNGQIISQNSSSTKVSQKQSTWGVGLNPGIIFFPNEKWGIDFSVGLLGYSEVIGESNSMSSLTLQPSSFNNLSLGLKYYIIR